MLFYITLILFVFQLFLHKYYDLKWEIGLSILLGLIEPFFISKIPFLEWIDENISNFLVSNIVEAISFQNFSILNVIQTTLTYKFIYLDKWFILVSPISLLIIRPLWNKFKSN